LFSTLKILQDSYLKVDQAVNKEIQTIYNNKENNIVYDIRNRRITIVLRYE